MRAGSMTVWRVLEVEGATGAPPTADVCRLVPGGFDVAGVVAPSGAEAIARFRVEHPPARRVWLYAATCRRRATRTNPNGVLVPPLGEVET
jgi:hypothetical protein